MFFIGTQCSLLTKKWHHKWWTEQKHHISYHVCSKSVPEQEDWCRQDRCWRRLLVTDYRTARYYNRRFEPNKTQEHELCWMCPSWGLLSGLLVIGHWSILRSV